MVAALLPAAHVFTSLIRAGSCPGPILESLAGGREGGQGCEHPSPADASLLSTGSAGESFLSTIQRAAEVVANAVRPGPENPSTQGPLPRGDTYQPAVTPSTGHTHPSTGNLILGAKGMEARAATLWIWVVPFCQVLGQGVRHFIDVEIDVNAALTAGAPDFQPSRKHPPILCAWSFWSCPVSS